VGTITAKQLKQRTGEIIKRVRAGERLTVTYRGEPVATISPSSGEEEKATMNVRPFEVAWADIEATIERTEPSFGGWQEAMDWVRKRTSS
jgi:prevent-host-death family protein